MLFDAQLHTYPLSVEDVTERVIVTLKIRCYKQKRIKSVGSSFIFINSTNVKTLKNQALLTYYAAIGTNC